MREKELLDLYGIIDGNRVDEEDHKIIKRRKKAIKKMRKSKYRRWSMKFLRNKVGRGLKRPLKHVIIEENNKMISQRDQME